MLLISDILTIIQRIKNEDIKINEETILYGSDGILDSLNFVELCIALEDKAEELNFIFRWNSKENINRIDNIFKNPRNLAIEFNNQFKNSKID